MKEFVLAAFADEAGSALEDQIKALKRNGIKHLEIRGVDGHSVGDIGPEEAARVCERLKNEGISVLSIGSPFGKQDINADFGPHFDKFRRCLESANALGAKYMRIFSFFMPAADRASACGTDPAHAFDVYFDEVTGRLSRFAEEAEKAGIVLCHENEKGIYGDVPERCVKIHEALPALRAVFDPANFIQCGADTLKAWSMLSPYVEYMHIKDAVPDGTVVAAGFGEGNIKALLSEFDGQMLTVEPHLAVFEGLAALEKDGGAASVDGARFRTKDEAFDFAVNALKKILSEL